MFESLTEKLRAIFDKLGGKGKLSEKDIDEALRTIRLALLEADVSLQVVKDFIAKIREKALTAQVMESLTPGQQIVKIVNEELISLLGPEHQKLQASNHPPSVVMLVGLQGAGKTTSAAKLALHLRKSGQTSLLVAADTKRPAAIDQLEILGKQLNLPVYLERNEANPVAICRRGVQAAVERGITWVLLDTAGRLHIDEDLMQELKDIKQETKPSEVLLVADAMTGQDAVKAAREFHSAINLTGLVLTKMDGDARGGAALSVRAVTGVPIKFIGVGEKPEALESFYGDRMASRILGMGDVLTLIEKAQQSFEQDKIKKLEDKFRADSFDLEDLVEQLRAVKKMGPLSQVMEMVPGFGKISRQIKQEDQEKGLQKIESVILSMTPRERQHPEIIEGSRKRRIARGSGTSIQDVNQLLNQFQQMKQMMKQLKKMKGKFSLPFMR